VVPARGGGRMKVDDEIVELKEWDAVRVPPGTWPRLRGPGPEGLEILVIGAAPTSATIRAETSTASATGGLTSGCQPEAPPPQGHGGSLMSSTVDTAVEIRPFHIEIPEELDRRLAPGASLRTPLAYQRARHRSVAGRSSWPMLHELAPLLGGTTHDWRKTEAKLNALPPVHDRDRRRWNIHFIHVQVAA